MKLSVILCAYNPNKLIFEQVMQSLKQQSLPKDNWELIIIDNNSPNPISNWLNLEWHPDARIVEEKTAGLIYARLAGTLSAKYDYLISVDDDTPLFPDYLEQAREIFINFPQIGIIGGRSYPIYESQPPSYINEFESFLAIRDLGDDRIIEQLERGQSITHYPICAPILIAPKKECMIKYYEYFHKNSFSKNLGRKGDSLVSGEDNDINLFIYKQGYQIGYFPELKFYHIIPEKRLTKSYLQKMAFESNRSWVKVLALHQILPWNPISKLTYPIRCLKSFFSNRAFVSEINYIKWKSSCGIFKGLSEVK